MTRPAPRPGHAFREGKLYEFNSYDIKVIRPWGPGAGAWIREMEGGGWKGFRPPVSLSAMERICRAARREAGTIETLDETGQTDLVAAPLPPSFAGRKAQAYESFLDSIPHAARTAIRPFAEGHWELLRLADRCGGPFLDLVASNPALALALALRRRLAAPIGASTVVARLLRRRQREIAGRLGFPATESSARLLRRIPVVTVSLWRLYHLRAALSDESLARRLCFAPRPNASVLRLLCDTAAAPLVAPTFIEELALIRSEDRTPKVAHTVLELRELHAALERPRPPILHSLRALDREHAATIRELGRAPGRAALARVGSFPSPPFPDADGFAAIRTADDLWLEGNEMKSCVAGYASRVSAGTIYFYRVTSPERGTLSVERGRDGWRLGEVRGPGNRAVARATRSRVVAWARTWPVPPHAGTEALSSDREDPDDSRI